MNQNEHTKDNRQPNTQRVFGMLDMSFSKETLQTDKNEDLLIKQRNMIFDTDISLYLRPIQCGGFEIGFYLSDYIAECMKAKIRTDYNVLLSAWDNQPPYGNSICILQTFYRGRPATSKEIEELADIMHVLGSAPLKSIGNFDANNAIYRSMSAALRIAAQQPDAVVFPFGKMIDLRIENIFQKSI